MGKLTKASIEQAMKNGVPAGKAHVMLWDDATLGLKLRPTGAASWVFVYRPIGAPPGTPSRTLTLGRWPALDLPGARKAATLRAGERAQGRDPAKELSVAKKRARWTVSAALDAYETRLRARRFVNLQTRMSALRRGLAPHLSKEIVDLGRGDLSKLLDQLETAGKAGAAADLRKATKGLLDFCVERDIVPFNPLAGLRRERPTRAEIVERDDKGRALDNDEIRRVWVAAGAAGSFGNLIRMALLTGCRKNELAKLTWANVAGGKIVISNKVAKQARIHQIPLSPLMKSILAEQRIVRGTAGEGSLVFPSSDGPEVQISGWTPLMEKLRVAAGFARRGETSAPPPGDWWSPHDLRRTCRTIMSMEGVEDGLAELALGHVTAGLIRTYNKDARETGRREAFERVSAHVERLILDGGKGGTGANIVPLKAAGAK